MSTDDHATTETQLRQPPSNATPDANHQLDETDILKKEHEFVGVSEPPEEYYDEGEFPDGGTRAWMVVLGVRSANHYLGLSADLWGSSDVVFSVCYVRPQEIFLDISASLTFHTVALDL